MSNENKKPTLKGSKENIKIATCLTVFIVAAVGGMILRLIQMASYIDPETGFYTGYGDWINLIFYIILAVNILFFCGSSYFSADSKRVEMVGQTSKIAAIGTRIMALGFLYDSFSSFFSGVMSSESAVGGYTDVMKSGTLPLLLQSFFALISAVYFFVFASDFSKGTAKAYKRKIMATAPVCWAGARLIYRFLRQISFVEVSDLFLELIMIAFMVMFFMALAQIASGVYKDNVKWRIAGFGLSAALIAAVLSVPRLIFTIVNSELIVSEHPFCLTDLLFTIFIVTLILKIKDDAKTPLTPSAEYTENKELYYWSGVLSMFLENLITAATNVSVLYIIVAVGYICDKAGIYTEETARKTVNFLLYFVASCTLINSFIKIEATPDTVSKFFTAFGLSVATHLIAILINMLTFRNISDERNAVYKFASIYGNVAFMALPLAQAVLGDEGVLYCAGGAVVFNLFTFTHGVKLMSKVDAKLSIKKILINPGVIATVIGLPIFLTGIEVPYLMARPIEMLADLNTPVAMLVFGTYLSRTDLKTMLTDKKIYAVAVMKLIVLPLICMGVYYLFGLSGTLLTAVIITASVPSANNTFMFSSVYGRDAVTASKTVALVSFLSIITMPVIIAITQLTW